MRSRVDASAGNARVMVILFWNIARNRIEEILGEACEAHEVDILMLAEAEQRSWDLVRNLSSHKEYRWKEIEFIRSRVRFFTRYPEDCVRSVYDDARVSIKNVALPGLLQVLIVGVHLRSKLYGDEADRDFEVRHVRDVMLESEAKVGHKNTVVIGDFNMAPFETPLVSAAGLHAVMDRQVAQRESRQVGGESFEFLFNPMWSRLGDETEGPPGTYYYGRSRVVNHFWYALDQVLLRPGLIRAYERGRMSVLQRISDRPLLKGGRPDRQISDHLPLLVELHLGSAANV